MSAVLDRIGDLYEEQRTIQARSGTFSFRDQDRERLIDIAAALLQLWEARRVELLGGSETARVLADEAMRGNARAIPTLNAPHLRRARQ